MPHGAFPPDTPVRAVARLPAVNGILAGGQGDLTGALRALEAAGQVDPRAAVGGVLDLVAPYPRCPKGGGCLPGAATFTVFARWESGAQKGLHS